MSVAANRYAKALIDVLYPDKADAGLAQLESFKQLLDKDPIARRFFQNPTVARERRKRLMEEIRKALSFDRPVANFIDILIDKERLELFDEIIEAYRTMLDDHRGIVRAKVTAAHPLDKKQQADLAAKLGEITGKQVRMELAIDSSLIGGVVAQVGSTVYDGSVRQQLQAFKNRLIEQ